MKKLFAILTLCAASASAQTSIGLDYDHSYGTERRVSLTQKTPIGSFDAALLGTKYGKLDSTGSDKANGFELGYANGLKYGAINVTGRVGAGRLNGIDPTGGGFISNTSYLTLGAEASVGLVDEFGLFANYRHRNPFGAGPNQNRFQVGVSVEVSPGIGGRVGISHARQAGGSGTGLTAALNYTF